MNILALLGSPRRGGNTEVLLDELLAAARSRGHMVHKVRLYDRSIRPCLDCRACKRREDHTCAVEDDMADLHDRLARADVLVFGTPIYWYGPTAQMKLLVDRLRPFVVSGALQGKKGILVAPSDEGPACCGPTVEMFSMTFEYLGISFAGSVLATAYEKGEVRAKPEELAKARELGASL